MTPSIAQSALNQIVSAMQTGVFDPFSFTNLGGVGVGVGVSVDTSSSHFSSAGTTNFGGLAGSRTSRLGRYRSKSMGAESDYRDVESIQALGGMFNRHTTLSVSAEAASSGTAEASSANTASAIFPSWGSSTLDLVAAGGAVPHHDDIEPIQEEPSYIQDEEPSFYMEEDEVLSPQQTPSQVSTTNSTSTSTTTTTAIHNTYQPIHHFSHTNINTTSPTTTTTSNSNEYTAEQLLVSPVPPTFTPLKPDRLIPVDLLGVIDDPSTPGGAFLEKLGRHQHTTASDPTCKEQAISNDKDFIQQCHTPEPIPASEPITATSTPNTVASTGTSCTAPAIPSATTTNTNSSKSKKKKSKNNDLAATLFSRPRSKSLCYEKSPKLKPLAAPHVSVIGMSGLSSCSASAVMNNSIPALFSKQLDSAVQILLTMNYDICEEAAYEAALVSNADVNVAQHVIDGAVSAPPVCRHLMNGGCYRSDCHYSHDIDGHTCLFWLRGRCNPNRKGEACRFMHGFSEKLLDGVNLDYKRNVEGKADSTSFHSRNRSKSEGVAAGAETGASKPNPIKTSNLVHHNMMSCFSHPKEGLQSSFTSSTEDSMAPLSSSGGSMYFPKSSSMPSRPGPFLNPRDDCGELFLPPSNSSNSYRRSDPFPPPAAAATSAKGKKNGKAFSFASIASKGYKEKSSFHKSATSTTSPSGIENTLSSSVTKNSKALKSVRIPQELWTANFNRSSSSFHITDPLSRYKEVSASVNRHDVIDLHFQSVKSFPIVLGAVLPEKLRDHGEIWVVTGSGHHVNRSSHQKGGGVLENSVIGWLTSNDYEFSKGKDKNGHGGAVLVHGKHR